MAINPTNYFLIIILISPLLAFFTNLLFFKKNIFLGSFVTAVGIWIGFLSALTGWFIVFPIARMQESWGFLANEVSWLVATLILFVSAIVHQFSLHYMAGDRNYRRYFLLLNLITISTLLMAASDNIFLLIFFLTVSNLILFLLMMHKLQWSAAKNSGMFAIKTFMIGVFFLSAGIGLLAYESKSFSLHLITENSEALTASIKVVALFFIFIGAFAQSACWPFHGWLISSLNSPTPVSALMHAGLVNGGGIILVRFAPLALQQSLLLDFLFIFAVITLILGGILKLVQADVKRMLACSTMTQMGFMMMQCSLGLFPAALAHLCWHSLFKAFLFLKSGSSITENQLLKEEPERTGLLFILSFLCGLIGGIGFTFGSGLSITFVDSTVVLLFFSWMAFTQIARRLLQKRPSPILIVIAATVCLTIGIIYGFTVNLIEFSLAPRQIWQPQPLNVVHVCSLTFIFLIWIGLNLKPLIQERSIWWRRFYVTMLNLSQPYSKTITANRNGYKY